MGTRNVTALKIDGEYKIAKYCQWDGYPSGVGIDVLDALMVSLPDVLKENLSQSTFYTESELVTLYEEVQNSGNTDNFRNDYPMVARDTNGGVVIRHLMKGPLKTKNDLEFIGDGLFCEWVYVVDFDENVLEVFKGFNKNLLDENERFKFLQIIENVEYKPPHSVAKWSLNELPTKAEFLATLEPADEDEDE